MARSVGHCRKMANLGTTPRYQTNKLGNTDFFRLKDNFGPKEISVLLTVDTTAKSVNKIKTKTQKQIKSKVEESS